MLFLLAFACSPAQPEATPAGPPVAEPAPAPAASVSNVNLGDAAFDDSTTVPIDTIVKDPATWDGKDVVVDAVVKEVCQKKGCWHTLATADPAVSVMVKDKEYAIFLPKDSAGKKVHVHGTFAVSELPEAEARHYAEDAGRDPGAIVGPQKAFTLDVAGVKFVEG